MGWAGGVSLFDKVMDSVLPRIPSECVREEVVAEVVSSFYDYDADTWDESKYFDDYADAIDRGARMDRSDD